MGRGLQCTDVLWSVARHGPNRTLHDKQHAYNVVGKAAAVFFVINQTGPLYTCKDLYDNQCTLEEAAEVTEKLDIIDKWVLLRHITLQGQVTCLCTLHDHIIWSHTVLLAAWHIEHDDRLQRFVMSLERREGRDCRFLLSPWAACRTLDSDEVQDSRRSQHQCSV